MQHILDEIKAERAAQDAKWGGPDHDDEHSMADFVDFIDDQLRKCEYGNNTETRKRLVKVAALCVAAIQSFDRGGQLSMDSLALND